VGPDGSAALSGLLVSPEASNVLDTVNVRNELAVPISLYWLDHEGRQLTAGQGAGTAVNGEGRIIGAGETVPLSKALAGHYVVLASASGAFVGTLDIKTGTRECSITSGMLVAPNEIGSFPKPTPSMLIPIDSPRVLVACGVAASGNVVTRDQYWRRTPDSFALAPGQSHTIGFSSTSGLQETTSEQSTVAASLGVSASGGWGPISASVSASLSGTSTSFHQVTVTSEIRRFETIVLKNESKTASQLFFKWQLMDVVTVFDKTDRLKPLSSIVLAQLPVLVGGPYSSE
jgi:hypothetical protein